MSEYTRLRRDEIKKQLIGAFGGKCMVCGYNRNIHALEFHHKDPITKEFNLGAII